MLNLSKKLFLSIFSLFSLWLAVLIRRVQMVRGNMLSPFINNSGDNLTIGTITAVEGSEVSLTLPDNFTTPLWAEGFKGWGLKADNNTIKYTETDFKGFQTEFKGIFDGDNKKIIDMTINVNAVNAGNASVGGIVGWNVKGSFDNAYYLDSLGVGGVGDGMANVTPAGDNTFTVSALAFDPALWEDKTFTDVDIINGVSTRAVLKGFDF